MAGKYALLIGNTEYEDQTLSKLEAPSSDVKRLAEVFRSPEIGGFENVEELINESESSVRRAIGKFFRDKNPDDMLVLYFSGHGILDDQGRLFLALKDTQRQLLKATAIASRDISDEMDDCRSKRQILILDCCHSGAFVRGGKGTPSLAKETFEGNGYGRAVLVASTSTQYALEGDRVIKQADMSLFSHYLLEGLLTGDADTNLDGKISLTDWYEYAYKRTVSKSRNQTPQIWTFGMEGELVPFKNPRPLITELSKLFPQTGDSGNRIVIRISGLQDAEGCYRIEARFDDGSYLKNRMKLSEEEERELISRSSSAKDYGQYLYLLLFNPYQGGPDSTDGQNLHNALQKSWANAKERLNEEVRIQLLISEECRELHRFRWERLYLLLDGDWHSLSDNKQTLFSRFTWLPVAEPQLSSDDRPLKMLLVVSNPDDLYGFDENILATLNVEKEIKSFYEVVKDIFDITISVMPGRSGISDELKNLLIPPKFHIISGPVTIKSLQKNLNHHILHYLGPSIFDYDSKKRPEPNQKTNTDSPENADRENIWTQRERFRSPTLLVLEDDEGHSVKVSDEQIVSSLTRNGNLLRLVFLSSSNTIKFDERNPCPLVALGQKLMASGIPAVVAMQDQVPIQTAYELWKKFYDKLVLKGIVDEAITLARRVTSDFDSQPDSWTAPVLFMRTPQGRLFTPSSERIALECIAEATLFREIWKYGYLPMEAVVLTESQINPNWENVIPPVHGRVDLHNKIQGLLVVHKEEQPLQIAITGQRGTALSSEIRRMILETAMESLKDDSRYQIIPIYVDLRKYVLPLVAVPSYLRLLAQSLSEFWPKRLTENDMERMLREKNRKFRFFFDHGDGLSESHRKELLWELDNLAQDYPRYPCLMTLTRGVWDWDKLSPTHVLDVQPLSRSRIIRFLSDCALLEEELRKGKGETQRSPEELALIQLRRSLEETQLFDLAGMPWMLVQLIHQALDGNFPESRVSVLQNLINERVLFITSRRGQQARALETLYALAYRMQVTGEPKLPIKQVLEIISHVRDNREYGLEEMLDSLVASDLLVRAEDEDVNFDYPAYQAYCCAQYLRIQNNPRRWGEIAAGLGDTNYSRRWENTLTLLAGLVNDPNDLLEKIAYATSLTVGEQVFLAARCLQEAHLNGKASELYRNPSYVESFIQDALVWRGNSENEPRALQRQRAVEALGQMRHVEVIEHLHRVVMERTRINSNGRRDFEHGGIRQAAGRALRRLLPARNERDNEYTAELERICPPLKELIQKWIYGGADEIRWLGDRMNKENDAKDEDGRRINDALASMAAFALGDLRNYEAHYKLIDSFLSDSTREIVRWAIADALAALDPEQVMATVIQPLITNGKLKDAEKFSERREQLIYLIGQLRHPEEKTCKFIEEVLTTPDIPYQQKGRAILTLSYLQPQGWKNWKTCFEDVVLCVDKGILKKADCDSKEGLHLRIRALQALAYLGDMETLERLRTNRRHWPSELEMVFFRTSEEIIWRNA